MRKLTRTQLRTWALTYLRDTQEGLCAVCQKPIEVKRGPGHSTDYVVDHCHQSGEIRGVLHRSCNGGLGKMDNAAGRWGAKSMAYPDILLWLKQAVAYYEKPGTGLIYPTYKTPEELHQAALLKQRKQRAAAKARAAVRAKEQA